MIKLPMLAKIAVYMVKKASPNAMETMEIPRRLKHKSVIHLGPSRQEVMEHYLVDPEVERTVKYHDDPPPVSPPQKKHKIKRTPRRRRSSIKQDTVDQFLEIATKNEPETEFNVESGHGEEFQKSLNRSGFGGLERLDEDDIEVIYSG